MFFEQSFWDFYAGIMPQASAHVDNLTMPLCIFLINLGKFGKLPLNEWYRPV